MKIIRNNNSSIDDLEPLIVLHNLIRAESLTINRKEIRHYQLLYVTEGKLNVSTTDHSFAISENQLILLSNSNSFIIEGLKRDNNFFVLSIILDESLYIYDWLNIPFVAYEDKDTYTLNTQSIEAKDIVIQFFKFIDLTYKENICSNFYADLKVKELLYLLGEFYPTEIIYKFLHPLLNSDFVFYQLVCENYKNAKSVKELATISNYNLYTFQNRFLEIFGLTAHAWMRKERLKLIYKDIFDASLTLKDISVKYNFSGPSHLNDFCKANLGFTPGYIRKKRIKIELESYMPNEPMLKK